MKAIRFIKENAPYVRGLLMILLFCRRDRCSFTMDTSYCRWCYRHAPDYCTCGECYDNKDYIDGK